MAGISSLGAGSGLDLQALVQRLVSAERAPAENRLGRNASALQSQVSGLGQLKSGLARLDDALKALSDLAQARTAQVSDTDKLTATATAAADKGSYSIEVLSLARAQSLASAGFADPDVSLGAGELTLTVGADDPVTITLEDGQDSLRAVRDAINDADAGARATLVRDGAEWRLLLTSTDSGTERTMSLTASAGVDARLESAAMTQTVAPGDALFSVAGLELSSPSNRIEDVLPGVTLVLVAETEPGQPLELTVGEDTQSARKAVDTFVSAYNALIELANNLGAYNPATGQGAALNGDSTLRAIRGALPTALGADNGGEWNAVQMGLRSDLNGKLSLDAEAFEARMAADPAAALGSLRGFGDTLGENIRRFSVSGGLIDNRTDGLKASLKSIDAQREALARRMDSYEQRLVRQFGALDQLVSQMQSTSSFLAAQLGNLNQGR
jgi:flagellar hook-associated protein 2